MTHYSLIIFKHIIKLQPTPIFFFKFKATISICCDKELVPKTNMAHFYHVIVACKNKNAPMKKMTLSSNAIIDLSQSP